MPPGDPDNSACVGFLLASLTNYERSIDFPAVQNTTKWDIWSAVYFACTLYTTIGKNKIYFQHNSFSVEKPKIVPNQKI